MTVFRIINQHKSNSIKKAVFLQHGIFRSSDDWLTNSEGELDSNNNYVENGGTLVNNCDGKKYPANTLGFVLADCGYDVWMGNSRGTTYSNQHQTMSETDPRFWKYSFQQMGHYDLPAVIDYILKTTNQSKQNLVELFLN